MEKNPLHITTMLKIISLLKIILPFLLFCKHPQNIKVPHTNKHTISPKTTTSTKRRNSFFKLQKLPRANHENHFLSKKNKLFFSFLALNVFPDFITTFYSLRYYYFNSSYELPKYGKSPS